MKTVRQTIAMALLGCVISVVGPNVGAGGATYTLAVAAPDPSALAEGEVRRIDKSTAKITIRHGPLAKLDMPPMTMVFTAKDPAMLDKVKVGDKIRFEAGKEGNVYTVMHIEPAK